jgi:hypothetical protein
MKARITSAERKARSYQRKIERAIQTLRENALSDADFRAHCAAQPEDVLTLRKLVASPGRHAAAQVRALELQLAYGHGRPKGQEPEGEGGTVNIQLVKVAQQILALPADVVETYARTGRLPDGAWLPGYQDRVKALEAARKPAPEPVQKSAPPDDGAK